MIWTISKSWKFSVKSLYSALEPDDPFLFLWSIIWNSCMSPKVAFFAWETTWGKALTLYKAHKRGFPLANRCFLHHFEEKTVDHILLHCAKTRILWQLLFTLFGVSWALPSSIRETLLRWQGFFLGKGHKKPWKVAPYVFFGPFGKKKTCLLLMMLSYWSKWWKTLLFVSYGCQLGRLWMWTIVLLLVSLID